VISGQPPFSPSLKQTLEAATEIAFGLGRPDLDTEHLLLGLLKRTEGPAAQVLAKVARPADLRLDVLGLAGLTEADFGNAPVFGRRAPVLVDIGAARARYFLNVGPHLPEVDLVGIEVAKKRVEKALEKLAAAGLGARSRMLWGNAVPILRDHMAEGSLAAIT